MGKLRLPRKKKKKLKKELSKLIKKGNSIRNKQISFICIDEIPEDKNITVKKLKTLT